MWSYSGDPATSTKDATRFYLGDTRKDAKLLDDEEIAFVLTEYPDPLAAAAACADALAAYYAREINKRVGPISVDYSLRQRQFTDLADTLWGRVGGRAMAVKPLDLWSGGIDKSERDVREANDSAIQPFFRRQLFEPADSPTSDALEDEE